MGEHRKTTGAPAITLPEDGVKNLRRFQMSNVGMSNDIPTFDIAITLTPAYC